MKRRLNLLAAMALTVAGCNEPLPRGDQPPDQEELITNNQRAARQEMRDIELYMKRHSIAATDIGTGVHVSMLRNAEGDSAEPDQLVTVNYVMELLSGVECYRSKPGEPESFRVEHDEVESGLHEAVQHLSIGDSALLIIPSHRAFGLIGDQAKVPMRSTVVYRIGVVDIKEAR